VDAVFDHLGGTSVTRSYRLLNRTGTLVSYSIASKLDDTSPVLPGFLRLLAKLAVWNLPAHAVLRPDRPRQDHPGALTASLAPAREPTLWKESFHKTAVSAGSRRLSNATEVDAIVVATAVRHRPCAGGAP